MKNILVLATVVTVGIIALLCFRDTTPLHSSSEEVIMGDSLDYEVTKVTEYAPLRPIQKIVPSQPLADIEITEVPLPPGWGEISLDDMNITIGDRGPEPLVQMGDRKITSREFQRLLWKAKPEERDRLLNEWQQAQIEKVFGTN